MELKETSSSDEETEALAARWALNLKPGDVVGLVGDLGAGKTTFTRGLYQGLGGDPDVLVTSPTFTLLQEYPLPQQKKLLHFDLYRLNSAREFEQCDFLDMFNENNIAVIEWGDKIEELKYYFNIIITLHIIDDQTRSFSFKRLK
ncbi:tRNA (adenosine(37)-N6)-threonylcarbamoyltransferase complex ATPase subunit type 1 TsaE [bacterium]|nr:tRNA (adenosine(37)-N6)-threonylcarbamoyltransferase complex ATPase subunit type 1 TsaE [bacterium]